MSCEVLLSGELFPLGKGIYGGCIDLDRLLVFLDRGGFCRPELSLKFGFNMEPVRTSPMGRG